MAGFHTKTFLKHDDYMTPKYAWENIEQYIPKDKVIWEAFMGDGKSGQYLEDMGFQVIANNNDFFESNEGDIIVSNPPFSKSKEIMERLKILDKPFIIHFDKQINGETPKGWRNACNFDTFYYCYKMNLPRDIIWLE